MIVDTMSMEEIQKEIDKLWYTLLKRTIRPFKAFAKRVSNKKFTEERVVWKHYDTLKINGNTIRIYYSCKEKKSYLGFHFFIVSSGTTKEVYYINNAGLVFRLSRHFIDRFIERTSCSEDFIPYFIKELTDSRFEADEDKTFCRTKHGLIVIGQGNTLITYMNDLSEFKQKEYNSIELRDRLLTTEKQKDMEAENLINMIRTAKVLG